MPNSDSNVKTYVYSRQFIKKIKDFLQKKLKNVYNSKFYNSWALPAYGLAGALIGGIAVWLMPTLVSLLVISPVGAIALGALGGAFAGLVAVTVAPIVFFALPCCCHGNCRCRCNLYI